MDGNELLYIRSTNNYIEIFWEDRKGVHSKTVRYTLKSIEEADKEYPFIFRCHRIFIVNITKFKRLEGNSQGYLLYAGPEEHSILVSRKYILPFKELFYKS